MVSEGITFEDIHLAIDYVFDIYRRYCALLLDTEVLRFAAMQPWETTFRHAWVPDDAAWRRVRKAGFEKQNRTLGAIPPRVLFAEE